MARVIFEARVAVPLLPLPLGEVWGEGASVA